MSAVGRRTHRLTPGAAVLACLLLAGCGGATPADAEEWVPETTASGTSAADAVNRMSVARYLRLQREAEEDGASAMLLGGYVAGLFSGLAHLAEVGAATGEGSLPFCMPPGLAPGLLDLLTFLDEALVPYRQGLRDAEATLLQTLMFEALVARFPCEPEASGGEPPA
ncbi:MAG: hypothetical protein JJT93_00940 [Gammaproteobacteria bacterium]|nr:hypothetical protein [Gammaproteobacteria bacterium]TVQ48627.1 MAG: hypothetical protein EA371_05650 [Gammaproteobacteria bacterium]